MFLPSFFGVPEKKTERPEDVPEPRTSRFLPPPIQEFPNIPPGNPKIKQFFVGNSFQIWRWKPGIAWKNLHFPRVFLPSISNFRRQALCARCRSTAAAPSSSASEAKARTSRKRSFCRPGGDGRFLLISTSQGVQIRGVGIYLYLLNLPFKKKQAHVGKPSYFGWNTDWVNLGIVVMAYEIISI